MLGLQMTVKFWGSYIMYRHDRRKHVIALKQLRDLGLCSNNALVAYHRGNLSYLRHQWYGE